MFYSSRVLFYSNTLYFMAKRKRFSSAYLHILTDTDTHTHTHTHTQSHIHTYTHSQIDALTQKNTNRDSKNTHICHFTAS